MRNEMKLIAIVAIMAVITTACASKATETATTATEATATIATETATTATEATATIATETATTATEATATTATETATIATEEMATTATTAPAEQTSEVVGKYRITVSPNGRHCVTTGEYVLRWEEKNTYLFTKVEEDKESILYRREMTEEDADNADAQLCQHPEAIEQLIEMFGDQ